MFQLSAFYRSYERITVFTYNIDSVAVHGSHQGATTIICCANICMTWHGTARNGTVWYFIWWGIALQRTVTWFDMT